MHTHYLDTSSSWLAAARSGHHNRYLTSSRPTPPTASLCLPHSTRVSLSLSPRIWIRGGSPASPLNADHQEPPTNRPPRSTGGSGEGRTTPCGSAPRSSSHHHDDGWLGRTTISPFHHGVLSNCPAPQPDPAPSPPCPAVVDGMRPSSPSSARGWLRFLPLRPRLSPLPPSACSLMISCTCLDTVMAEVEDPLVKVAFDVCVT